jgi:multiple sugar transport system permease protein
MKQTATLSARELRHGYRARRNRQEKMIDRIALVIILLFAAAAMLPIWWIFRSSLMTNTELYAFPPSFFPSKWLFSNYAETLETFKFWLYFGNTMKIIVPSVLLGTLTATICGYAFARLRFRGKKLIFSLCVGSMLLPGMVTLVPLYIMWTQGLHLGNTYWPMILPYCCGGGAFNIFLIKQFISTIPRELDEAATLDGANRMTILFRILLPAIKPAMIVVALFLFVTLWNDLLQQTIYINSADKFTIAIGLTMFRSGLKADWAKIMCATCLSFVPGVIIFLFGQRYFVEGIVMTGMKN